MSTYQIIIPIPKDAELQEGQTLDDLVYEQAVANLSAHGYVDVSTVKKEVLAEHGLAVFTADVC